MGPAVQGKQIAPHSPDNLSNGFSRCKRTSVLLSIEGVGRTTRQLVARWRREVGMQISVTVFGLGCAMRAWPGRPTARQFTGGILLALAVPFALSVVTAVNERLLDPTLEENIPGKHLCCQGTENPNSIIVAILLCHRHTGGAR